MSKTPRLTGFIDGHNHGCPFESSRALSIGAARKGAALFLMTTLGVATSALAATDSASPWDAFSSPLSLLLLLLSIPDHPYVALALMSILLVSAWMVHLWRDKKQALEEQVSSNNAENPAVRRLARKQKIAVAILVLAILFIVGWWQTVQANFKINRLVKSNDYAQLDRYLNNCLFCRWALKENDNLFFFSPVENLRQHGYKPDPDNYPPPHLSKVWKKKVFPEILGLLCKRGADCGGVNVNLLYLNSAEPALIDAHLSSGGQLGYLEADLAIYRAVIISGRADVLEVLLKHGLRSDHSSDPSLDLLNVAIFAPSPQQARIITLLKANGASARGVPEIYQALAESYLANSVAPLAALQIKHADMVRYFERFPGKTDEYLYVSYFHSAPLWMALNWPEKPGWIERLLKASKVDVVAAINNIQDETGRRQWDVRMDLKRTEPELYNRLCEPCRQK